MVHIQQGLYSEAINDLQEALKLQDDRYAWAGWAMPMPVQAARAMPSGCSTA